MSDQHNHHHHHRPHRLSVPPRFPNTSLTTPTTTTTTTLRSYPLYPKISTPTPTPSKHRLSSIPSLKSKKPTNSVSSLFLILFSLRSLYSLLPFLRSSPSFSLFPFSFLVSLLSFLLTLSFFLYSQQKQSIAAITNTITKSQFHLISAKSVLLAVVFLLRFQALRYCGTAATILAELSGNVAARFVTSSENQGYGSNSKYSKIRGFVALGFGLFLFSISWDRMECFPLSLSNMRKHEGGGFVLFPGGQCYRVLPMLLPFLCGFLGCYERVSGNWGSIRGLGRKRVQLITLLFTTILLFFPALVSFFMFEEVGVVVSIGNLSWPLANTVVFGVILTENYTDDKFITSKDFQKEFVAIFVCTLVLELFYFPELSLCGLLFCGLLLWISIRELDPVSLKYPDLGFGSPDSFSSMVMKPIRHILSERKSRKIALFLFINTAYMVVEFVAGFMSNSLGLISDACHMLFDCAALAIGLYASYISRLPANSLYNYGRGRFEVLSGYVNAVLLVLVGALIVLESFERILDPQEISTSSLLTVSIGGLVVNMVGLIFFHEEHHHAHGGAGSCSHSHPHPHAHSHSHSHDHQHSHNHDAHDHTQHSHNHDAHDHTQHSHNHDAHDHTSHNDHHECSISHGKSCDGHDHQSHSHTHHDHHDHNNEKKYAAREQQTTPSHNHQHHEHEHECHSHDHHHNHPDHHEHHHPAGKHAHQNSIGTSTSPQNDSHESHSHDEFHAHNKSCNHKDHSNSSHIHSHQSDFSNHSPFESSDPQLKVPLLESVAPKETGKKHQHVDHNMEGIFLHVLADTLGSVGVVISTLLIKYKGWLIADPVCSIFISVMIISSVISLLRNSAEILLQRIPRVHEQELKQAVKEITSLPGVHDIGNLHVWSFTNTDVIGTLHLQLSPSGDTNSTKAQVSHILLDAGINDLTLQTESVKDK